MTERRKEENPEEDTSEYSSSKEELRNRAREALEKANAILEQSGRQDKSNKPHEDDESL